MYLNNAIGQLFLFTCLTLTNVATASELLPISKDEVLSIKVIPNNVHSANSYTLKIYADTDMTKQLVAIKKPLEGTIIDVDIKDIDGDHAEELVITTQYKVKLGAKHLDIFEFVDNSILGNIQTLFIKLF